jgi:hypothetical protein
MQTRQFFELYAERSPIFLIALALTLAASLLPVAGAAAKVIPVTSAATAGPGSLRAAIEEANALAGGDSIPIEFSGTITLASALPPITGETEISGPGAGLLTVRRGAATGFRIFEADETTLSISGLTVTGGLAREGAGILTISGVEPDKQAHLTLTRVAVRGNEAFATGGTVAAARGGGISSTGTLVLRESLVTENFAKATNATTFTEAFEAGIAAEDAVVDHSTIARNVAQATSLVGAVRVFAGGASLEGPSSNLIQQSTISENVASAGGGSANTVAETGGIFTTGLITGSTISGNAVVGATATGSNVSSFPETVIRDSIVANGHGAPNCELAVASGGFNIDDGASCGFAAPGDLPNTDPMLDPNLADNGGPTPTHALLAGPAIDRGSSFGAATDQRGLPRPSDFATVPNAGGGDGSDIGAVERQVPGVRPPPPPPRDTVAPNTKIGHGPPHRTRARQAKFRFSSSERGSRFECKVDRGRFRPCSSPFQRMVKAGARHLFRVRATDAAGNVDPTPARYRWRVLR